jgi:Tfp pilus assembly protein PilF
MQGDYFQAIALAEIAISAEPTKVMAKLEIAIALGKLNKMEEACDIFHRVLEENGNVAPILVNVGLAYLELEQPTNAVRYLREAVRQDPQMVLAHSNLGIALMEEGAYGAAVLPLSQAIKLAPDWDLAHYNLALALEKSGNHQKAMAELECALTLNPEDKLFLEKLQELKQRPLKTVDTQEFFADEQTQEKIAFVGTFDTISVPDLLEFFRNTGSTGILFITSAAGSGQVHFFQGKLTAASSPHSPKLGTLLTERYGVPSKMIAETINDQGSHYPNEPLGALLVSQGNIELSLIRMALQEQIKFALLEMLDWKEGDFVFEKAELAPDLMECNSNITFDVQEILLDLFREKDEQNRDKFIQQREEG